MSVQGLPGGERIGPRLQNNVLIPYGWSEHIGPFVMEASLQGESDFDEKDDKHAALQQFTRYEQQCSLLDSRKMNRDNHGTIWDVDRHTMQSFGLILRLAHNKGLEFWQTVNNAIILYDSMPPDCQVKVVKRNLDDTEAEILYKKEQLEDREDPWVIFKENPAAKCGEDLIRKERIAMRLKKVIDQRSSGIPKGVINKTRIDMHLVSKLVKRMMEPANTHELVEELFPKGVKFTTISERSKRVIKEQATWKRVRYVTSQVKSNANTASTMWLHDTKIVDVDAQLSIPIQHEIKQKFDLLMTPDIVLMKGSSWRRQHSIKTPEVEERGDAKLAFHNARRHKYTSILDRWINDDMYRESQLAFGLTIDMVNHWDRLDSNGHPHHCTKEKKKRYQQIFVLKRDTGGTMPQDFTSHHLEFCSAIQERHTVAAAHHLHLLGYTDSKQDSSQPCKENSFARGKLTIVVVERRK